jgi:hypothetical protein
VKTCLQAGDVRLYLNHCAAIKALEGTLEVIEGLMSHIHFLAAL